MKIEFEHEYLQELYEDGKATNKKFRFQPQIIHKYKNTIDRLRAARRIEDLFLFKSLNYEKLSNSGIESVRVDGKYRIEFRSRMEGQEPETITICSITKLSNHYK